MPEQIPVILYYKYVRIDNPVAFTAQHKAFCESLQLKGRVLVAEEGINGTLAGTNENIEQYKTALHADPRFADMEFKISYGDTNPFPRLAVKARKEIVALHYDGLNVDPACSNHLSPEEWQRMIDNDPDVVLVDVRNIYEYDAGRFKNAIPCEIEYFRDLPAYTEKLENIKDKKVLMYCTGGIRCEKASELFKQKGFQTVYQLHGGIMEYLNQVGDKHWEGDCFVFDGRMTIGDESKETVGRCRHTGLPARHFQNCLHDPCHTLFLVNAEELAKNPYYQLCPECLKSGRTPETADYKGSPARQKAPA